METDTSQVKVPQQKWNYLGLRTFKTKVDDSGLENITSSRVDYDPFEPFYTQNYLVEPPYKFVSLYRMYEESDILHTCVSAYQKNIDGFGYRLDFLGDDLTERDTKEAILQYNNITRFFDQPNSDHPFRTIRSAVRKDYEVLGQGALEVVRFRSGGISAVYYLPMVDIRMAPLDTAPTTIVTNLYRDGRWRKVNVKKRFRKFAQIQADGSTLKWFKSLGDPRIMDATTGEYVNSRKAAKEIASEVLLIQQPTNGRTYGLPRWIANVVDIAGRTAAQYINYDISNSQGIPPMLVIVENGMLTDESREALHRWAESMRGPENFNRIGLLEAIPELHGIDDKGTVKIQLKSLAADRSSDLMFEKYLSSTAAAVRQAFRLPSLYLGDTGDMSYAGSYTTQKVTEEQVFVVERERFDDIINHYLVVGELKSDLWKYVSLGPKVVSAEELRLSLKEFASSGAISINNSIDIMNELFGLNVSKYDEDWASLPVAILKIQANNGTFTLPEITNSDPKGNSTSLPGQAGKPDTTSTSLDPPIVQPTQKLS